MNAASDLLSSIAALGWLALAAFVAIAFRSVILDRRKDLTKFSAGPTGFTMEFVSQKLDEQAKQNPSTAAGVVDKSALAMRLDRDAALVRGAHVLWVDDHPEDKKAVVDLLAKFGIDVELATSNADALASITRHPRQFSALISDVARDAEAGVGAFPGVEFAERALAMTGVPTILFSARFRPTSVPGLSADERLKLADLVERVTFGCTNRADELVHLVLDVISRGLSAPRPAAPGT